MKEESIFIQALDREILFYIGKSQKENFAVIEPQTFEDTITVKKTMIINANDSVLAIHQSPVEIDGRHSGELHNQQPQLPELG